MKLIFILGLFLYTFDLGLCSGLMSDPLRQSFAPLIWMRSFLKLVTGVGFKTQRNNLKV